MNNRDYKMFATGEYYHLFNRGNGKMNIFRDDSDYRFLLARLREYLDPRSSSNASARRKTFPPNSFSMIAYCLMPNHFHFLIRQNQDASLSTLMLNLWSGYSKSFNKKYDRVGSIFQDQFKAIHVDNDSYLHSLTAYIHANPETAGIASTGEEYPYSSYSAYLGTPDGITEAATILEAFKSPLEYRRFVQESAPQILERKDLARLLID